MKKYVENESGLVVPEDPPEPEPEPNRGPLEIRDAEKREQGKKALLMLWEAMGLECANVPDFEPPPSRGQIYRDLYYFIGHMLLGDECPEGWEYT